MFWHKHIVEKLYWGYSLAMIFIAKLFWGYVLATNFACQNIPPVYLCLVEYVCLLHRVDDLHPQLLMLKWLKTRIVLSRGDAVILVYI